MLADQLSYRVRAAGSRARSGSAVPKPLVGDAIFDGTDYPRTWQEFVGQQQAVARLKAACFSARHRQQRMDHVLIASGIAGVGKTALARLVAADLGTGFVEVSGPIKVEDARPILNGMQDNDVLFYDEIHQAVSGGSAKAEWLLQLLQDGRLVTKSGVEELPKITVIAATTDAQKLPTTILGRFPIKPVIEPYTEAEAALIGTTMAERLGFGGEMLPHFTEMDAVAKASNGNPRDMRAILIALRDTYFTSSTYDLDQALTWVGVTHDGLSKLAQDYLLVLLVTFEGGPTGEKTLASTLGEPGGLRHTEQLLVQKGYITIKPNGRQMTESGVDRAALLLKERGLIA